MREHLQPPTRRLASNSIIRLALILLIVFTGLVVSAQAQTSSFTYQGRLTDGGTAANGNYDLQFTLWDSLSGGTQIGSPQTISNVNVSSGVFSVALDFGAGAFTGPNRFLEISTRVSGGGSFTLLTPREQVTSTPYAVRSSNATQADTATNSTQLGGLAAGQYVQTSDSRLTNSRPPTPGSSSYIQNTGSEQSGTNFNIGGNGTVSGTLSGTIVNAATQYNIAGARVLSTGPDGLRNIFAGGNAGQSIVGGFDNSFFGLGAGQATTEGAINSFFGYNAGLANILGGNNAFFGAEAGANNNAFNNSFFGNQAGTNNTTGADNSAFGSDAGFSNFSGSRNVFVGVLAGQNTATSNNTFVGYLAGSVNTTGAKNTLIGANANVGSSGLINATAIGADSVVSQSNSVVIGSTAGGGGIKVGIGTSSPAERLTVATAADNFGFVHTDGTVTVGSYVGGSTGGGWYGTKSNHSLSFFVNNGSPSMTIATGGQVSITTLGSAGSTQLCRNASNQISACSSSLRYKTNLGLYRRGLDVINRLRPITFDWKEGGMHDVGFGAEDVAQIDPLLVTYNDKGQVEGVKYDRISVALVNAIKEQQTQIETLKTTNAALSARLQAVERLIHKRTAASRRHR